MIQFYLWVDEAHSIGAMGPHGRGVCDYWGVNPQSVDILMGTFTKSCGAAGGYISGKKEIVETLRLRSSTGPYAEAMAPPVLTQILASMASIMGVTIVPEHKNTSSLSILQSPAISTPSVDLDAVTAYPGTAPSTALPSWMALPQAL